MKPNASIPSHHRSERGVALIIALLVLLVMSAVAVVMMSSLNSETKLTGYSVRQVEALNTAEAGVTEAMARIRNGDVVDDGNPRKVTQIFLQPLGSVPVLGVDSLALATGQPAGAYLAYSNTAKATTFISTGVTDVLTIKYKTNAARTLIYKYDKTKSPPEQTATGDPIFTIDVVGKAGNVSKHVHAEVVQLNIIATVKGSVETDTDIKLNGNGDICGFNHDLNTPNDTSAPAACVAYHVANPLPGVWGTVPIGGGGASTQSGSPAGIVQGAGFPAGPWETLGMSQAAFYSWIGAPSNTFPAATSALVYLDNDGVAQNNSGSWSLSGTRSGLVYADGSMGMNAGSVFRGLLYCEGDISMNGHAWIIGGVVSKGSSGGKINGGMTILYSSDVIKSELSKLGGGMFMLAWREV